MQLFSGINKENKIAASKLIKSLLRKAPHEGLKRVLFITMVLKASKVFHALTSDLSAQLGDLAQHAKYEEVESFTAIYEKGARAIQHTCFVWLCKVSETNHRG